MRQMIEDALKWIDGASWRGWLVHAAFTVLWCSGASLASDSAWIMPGIAWYYTIREVGHLATGKGKSTDKIPTWFDRVMDVLVPWIVTGLIYGFG